MKAYIGVDRCCGVISAAMVDDDKTSAKDVADFARDMHKSSRDLRHVEVPDGSLKLARCECGKTRRLALGE
jgi:hypothetical protein